jgi:hypothetical protein
MSRTPIGSLSFMAELVVQVSVTPGSSSMTAGSIYDPVLDFYFSKEQYAMTAGSGRHYLTAAVGIATGMRQRGG